MRKAFLLIQNSLFYLYFAIIEGEREVSSNIIRHTQIDVIIPDISIKVLLHS